MTVPTNGVVIHSAPTEPLRRLSDYDSTVTPGQPLYRCTCGRLFRPQLRLGHTYGEVSAVSPDPSRCDACQAPAAATS